MDQTEIDQRINALFPLRGSTGPSARISPFRLNVFGRELAVAAAHSYAWALVLQRAWPMELGIPSDQLAQRALDVYWSKRFTLDLDSPVGDYYPEV